MTIELVSDLNRRTFRISPRAFGKLLHLAHLHGWYPEQVHQDWPSDTWQTEIILPHLGPYIPGHVSKTDAEGLRRALTRALAVGDVAAEGTVYLASQVLLQVARAGGFRVRLEATDIPDEVLQGITTQA